MEMRVFSPEENGWSKALLDDLITSEKIVLIKGDLSIIAGHDVTLVTPNIIEILDQKFYISIDKQPALKIQATMMEHKAINN
jgi:RNA binding exosome subunit